MTRLERMEFEVLTYAHLTEMPPELDEKTPVWVYAVGRILMRNMCESYVILRNDVSRQTVIKSFDVSGGMAKILSIHPYVFLDEKYVPRIKKNEAVSFVAKAYGVPRKDVAALPASKVSELLQLWSIRQHVSAMRSEQARREALARVRDMERGEESKEESIQL